MKTPVHEKILYVITKSGWGGAQRYVFDLATGLRNDFDVEVAFGQEGLLADKLRNAGIRTLPIRSLQRDISFMADVKSFFELYRLYRNERPAVVHLNSSKAAGLGALAARFAGVPRIIFTAHGWPFKERRNNIAWLAFALLGSYATALLSHAIIVVSQDDLRIGKRFPFCAHKMHLIYNGIELPTLGSGDIIRKAFPSGAHITGTIGELTKNKNQIALIEEAKKNPEMCAAIVGEGEERVFLTKKIEEYGLEERVTLFGFLPATDVLRGFDTFALPSLKEGLPYVLIEARMAGLPIVANRIGGVGEILDAKDMHVFSLDEMVKKTIALYG